MNYGGDAADQIIRYSLDGMDHMLRLSGTLAKDLAVFFAAVLKDQKKSYGKTRLIRMLKENKPLKFFTVPSNRLKEFAREGKKRGLLYVIIRDKKNLSQCEVMVFADDAAKVNRVMDKMNLDFLKLESAEAVHEVTMEVEKTEPTQTETAKVEPVQTGTETAEPVHTEPVTMPEGTVQFELGDIDEEFWFGDMGKEENFTEAGNGRDGNLSELSLHSSDTSSGAERSEQKPSVRKELEEIKKAKQQKGKKYRSNEKISAKKRNRNKKKGKGR